MFLSSCAPFGTDANNIRALRVLILFHNEKEMDWGHKRSPPYSFLFFICMCGGIYISQSSPNRWQCMRPRFLLCLDGKSAHTRI